MKLFYFLLLLVFPAMVSGQISGSVKNKDGVPFKGITVHIKDTKIYTASDDNGRFYIDIKSSKAILVFTGTNIETLEFKWNGEQNFHVVLTEKVNTIDEIQIIAYGTTTQRLNVGSATKVSADDIEKQAVSNPLSALQGMVPGMVVTSTSGLPGSSLSVQIRGQNTINSAQAYIPPKDNPLFVIDGVPFSAQNNNVNQYHSLASPGLGSVNADLYGGISPFNSINPDDIESIEVLRDAAATAIYGSRGGNGVILITTKKGKAGKTQFSLDVRNGITFLGSTMPMMNTEQYVTTREQAFKNDGIVPNTTLYDPGYAPDLLVFDTTRYTNWKKFFLGNTAHNTNANAAISGGTQQTQFRIGTGFNQDTYIFPGDFADNRFTFSTSLHHSSGDQKFTLDFTAGYSYDKNNSSSSTNLLSAYTLDPDYPALQDPKGNLLWGYNGVPLDGSGAVTNPLSYLKDTYSIQNTNLNSSLIIGYKLLNGLTFRTSLGYSTYDVIEYVGEPAAAQNPEYSPVAQASFGTNNFMTWNIEPQLEYKQSLNKSAFDILVGGTFEKDDNSSTNIAASGYLSDALIGSISGAPDISALDSYSEYKYNAGFGRINYKYDDKYIIDVSARRDGSSRFGPDRQFGNFGSVGAGWLFNQESFIKDNFNFLSYGKLRGSYGVTGSDALADYQYLSLFKPTNFNYDGSLGYQPQNLSNPNLSWASTKKLEFGLELGFLQDKILFLTDWFRNRTGDQLVSYQLPSQTGFTSVYENLGATVQNEGIEASLRANIIKSAKFMWTTSVNITFPQNKLISFPGLAASSYATTYQLGKSLESVYGLKSAGVNPQTGLYQFYDANGNITSNPNFPSGGSFNDYRYLGNLDPKFYGGIQSSFNYSGVQLDLYFTYKKQLGYNYLRSVYTGSPGLEGNLPATFVNAWRSPGQQTNIQMVSSQYGAAYTTGSDFDNSSGVISDASYLRLKTLAVSYAIPSQFLKRLNIQNVRIYATGQNLFTITDYKGNDPETQLFYGVPVLKSITLGLQLTL